jgi:predicted RNase H-like nuclease (RuvC/YqgF family)
MGESVVSKKTIYNHKKQEGEIMDTTKELKEQIAHLSKRMVSIKDELFTLREELSRFKSDVASDVKYLTDAVKTKGGPFGR